MAGSHSPQRWAGSAGNRARPRALLRHWARRPAPRLLIPEGRARAPASQVGARPWPWRKYRRSRRPAAGDAASRSPRGRDRAAGVMTLFHFGNCFALAYFPYFITYKCSGL